jgi:hypothetical protein
LRKAPFSKTTVSKLIDSSQFLFLTSAAIDFIQQIPFALCDTPCIRITLLGGAIASAYGAPRAAANIQSLES